MGRDSRGGILTGSGICPICPISASSFSAVRRGCGAAGYILAARRHLDTVPLALAYTLLAVGLIEVARLKPDLFAAQLRWACVGTAAWMLVLLFWARLRRMLAYPYVLGAATTIVLLLPLLFGVSIGGNKNWLAFGAFSVQPSEFGKILLVFFLAAYLADHHAVLTLPARRVAFLHLPPVRFIAPLVALWGLSVLMFVIAHDLGAALFFFGMAVVMTYMGTGRKSYVFLAGVFILAAAALSYMLFGHVRVRFDIWMHPWADPNGMSYQIVQSLFAIGSGGVWGTGLSEGHPGLIPEVHTDFIFSAIAEEFGLIGAVFVLMAYALLFWRGIQIALRQARMEETLLAAGAAVALLLQAAGVHHRGGRHEAPAPDGHYPAVCQLRGQLDGGEFCLSRDSDCALCPTQGGGIMTDGKMRRHIAAAAACLLVLIAVQILYLVKISVWDGASLAAHPLNMRSALMEEDIRRGRILDHTGRVLAESDAAGNRSYPYGAVLAPVTGYRTDRHGATGIEQTEGTPLSGVTNDVAGMGPLRTLLRADAGYDVRLTVDAELSQTAYRALGEHRGAVVVMDAETGALLAMVSTPSFDPSVTERSWDTLSSRADSPLLNRAAQGLYPPGSTFKTLVADAALATGVTTTDEIFDCTGELAIGRDYVLHEPHGEVHGRLRLADALRESCNITFATLAMRMGDKGLSDAFDRFGIGAELNAPEVSMAAAHVPALRGLSDGEITLHGLSDGEIAQLGFGQGQLLVTPLQMALVADAFANGGRIMQPYLVDAVLTTGGIALETSSPKVWRTATTPERAGIIDGDVRVTGKTGTAENATGTDHAWFIGSAERGGRKIVLSVLVEEGGFGGRAAAGIARQIIRTYFEG